MTSVVSLYLSDELIMWLDSKLETPYGKLRRSEVIRHLLEDVMNKEQ